MSSAVGYQQRCNQTCDNKESRICESQDSEVIERERSRVRRLIKKIDQPPESFANNIAATTVTEDEYYRHPATGRSLPIFTPGLVSAFGIVFGTIPLSVLGYKKARPSFASINIFQQLSSSKNSTTRKSQHISVSQEHRHGSDASPERRQRPSCRK